MNYTDKNLESCELVGNRKFIKSKEALASPWDCHKSIYFQITNVCLNTAKPGTALNCVVGTWFLYPL